MLILVAVIQFCLVSDVIFQLPRHDFASQFAATTALPNGTVSEKTPLLGKGGALHNKSGEVPDMQSAIANRRFVTSLCIILSNPLCREVIDKADCIRMFQIGDRRMLVAYFRTEIVRRDLLFKAGSMGQ